MATQLDLFGMFAAPAQAENKKIDPAGSEGKDALAELAVADDQQNDENVLPSEVNLAAQESLAANETASALEGVVDSPGVDPSIIFSDHKIAVKIKLKNRPTELVDNPVAEPRTELIESPAPQPAMEEKSSINLAEEATSSDEHVSNEIIRPQESTIVNNTELPAEEEENVVIIDDLFSSYTTAAAKDGQVTSKKYVQTELPIAKKRGRKSFKEIDAEVSLVSVPEDETLFAKQYYAISQVAKWFNVNTSLLRYWENEFDVLKPRKNRKGDRLFRPEDIKNLQVIYYLLRQRKFSIEGAKKYLKENKKSADTNIQLIQSLTKLKGFLLELKANLGT